MKHSKNLRLLLILLMVSQLCLGQTVEDEQPTENWLKKYTGYNEQFLYHRFDRYSTDDVIRFREKLDLLNNSKNTDEWNGTYTVGTDDTVGFSQLRLKSDVGFASFYVYTCLPELRQINYGKIMQTDETIKLMPEFGKDSPRKSQLVTYVKVKWNNNRYLVEESSLSAFAEKAVGVYVEPKDVSSQDSFKWNNYLVSASDEDNLTGLPEFPASYNKFQRSPIEAKIVSIGARTVEEKTLGNASYSESAFYEVKVDAGENKKLKEGMIFEIPESESEVFIIKVNAKSSIGLIRRDIDENDKSDLCRNDEFNQIPCPTIKTPIKIKTIVGILQWF